MQCAGGSPVAGEKILLVDDEAVIATAVRAYLERDGYRVITAADGRAALQAFEHERPDLVILDLMLPAVSGWEVCRRIRGAAPTPIILLSARTEETDKVAGLKMGADDYVTKPFSPAELVARVEAVLRRTAGAAAPAPGERLSRPGLDIHLAERTVRVDGRPVELTPTEFRLLALLAAHPGRVFSRRMLLEHLRGEAFQGDERTIYAHIKNLRTKLGDDSAAPRFIQTVFGVGYRFVRPRG